MLVLSRKKNETIVMNSDIMVTVLEIRRNKIRLGIVAPKGVPIHRQKVQVAIDGKVQAPSPGPASIEKAMLLAPVATGTYRK